MTAQLPLQRFDHWLNLQPDAVWRRRPINGQWHDLTWRQVDDQARRLASALLALGCAPGDRVALLSKSCAERFMVEFNSLYCGAPVAFVESMESFASDLRHVRPTVFFSVPRLWTRFQQGVLEQLPQARLARLLRIPLLGGLLARKIRRGLGLDRRAS